VTIVKHGRVTNCVIASNTFLLSLDASDIIAFVKAKHSLGGPSRWVVQSASVLCLYFIVSHFSANGTHHLRRSVSFNTGSIACTSENATAHRRPDMMQKYLV